MMPLYRDETFYKEFMQHDIENRTTELRSFLAEVDGIESKRYKSYFDERDTASIAGVSTNSVTKYCKRKAETVEEAETMEENQQLESSNKKSESSNQNLCGVCYTNERNILTHPCSHLFICLACYTKTSTPTKNIKCTYCRAKITGYSIVYQP